MTKKTLAPQSDRIRALYDRVLFRLPAEAANHFAWRAYAITGEKKYIPVLAGYAAVERVPAFLRQAQAIAEGKVVPELGRPLPRRSARQRTRAAFYARQPKALFYDDLLNTLFFLKQSGLLGLFPRESRLVKAHLAGAKLPQLYLREQTIRQDSSYAVNAIAYLADLGIVDQREQMQSRVREIYLTAAGAPRRLKQDDFQSLVYDLTHMIIADSRYYARFVSGSDWILDFFATNLPAILQRATVDIQAEVALCFKLCQAEARYPEPMLKLRQRLVGEVATKQQMQLPGWAARREHTQSILMLLFASNRGWHKPANLAGQEPFQSFRDNRGR